MNPDFFVNLVGVAAKVAPIIVSSNNSSGGTQRNFSTQQITDLATSIQTLIRTPVSSVAATENKNEEARLMSGRRFITIEPNNPLDITLFSFPSVGASGFTSWKSNALTLSRYMMSTVMNGAAPREWLEACCSRPTAIWISGAMPDWPSVRSNIQSHIRSAWPQRGTPPTVGSDFGRIYGSLPINCTEDSEIELGGIRPGGMVLSDDTWVEQKGDGVYFKESTILLDCKYVVYDLNGRILKQGIGMGTYEKILDYNKDSNESRFYIVHVYINGVNKVFKIFKP